MLLACAGQGVFLGKRGSMTRKVPVYAVVRIEDGESIEVAITVVEILPTMDQAIQETERLNKLNNDKGARYFWQATRYFPDGRSVKK